MVYYFKCMLDNIVSTTSVTNGRIENGIVYIESIPSYITYNYKLSA